MKLFSRIFGTDEHLARMDRRAFLRGMSVTAAGLVVPLPTVFVPPAPRVDEWWIPIFRDLDEPDWVAVGTVIKHHPQDALTLEFTRTKSGIFHL